MTAYIYFIAVLVPDSEKFFLSCPVLFFSSVITSKLSIEQKQLRSRNFKISIGIIHPIAEAYGLSGVDFCKREYNH